jgi:hypothetical protein
MTRFLRKHDFTEGKGTNTVKSYCKKKLIGKMNL